MSIDASLSAMQAMSVGMQVAANNIANVNTEEFQPSRVTYEEVPDYSGVRVQDIQQTSAQGAPEPVIRPEEVNGVMEQAEPLVPSSGTDLATEMVSMMTTQNAFEANAVSVRTQDEMLGAFIDEMV